MRIESLRLLAFGPFTDKSLDFSTGNFQLVYGQNEAGKSSMLRAIEAALFGIPSRTKDTFVHRGPDLRVGAVLKNRAGDELAFKRRKGNKGTLRSLDDSEDTLPDNSLNRFLHGVERERFHAIHCIDHDEFRAGGQTMLELKGLAGDTLLAASNSTNFPSLQNSLAADTEALFAARKRSSRLKVAINEYNEAKDAKRQLEVSVTRWEKLLKEKEKLEKQRDDIRTQCSDLDIERRRLEQLRSALPAIAKWKSKCGELEKLGGQDAMQLPASYSIDDRRACETELTAANVRIGELEKETCELQSQLSEIVESPEYLTHADDIDDLQHRIGTQKNNSEERGSENHKLEVAEQAIKRLLAELGFEIEFDKIDSKRLQRDHRVAIRNLAADEKALRNRARELKQEKAQTAKALATNAEQRKTLGESIDVGDLIREVKAAEQIAASTSDLDQLREEHDAMANQAKRELRSLPYWQGTLDDLVNAPVPMHETIDKFDAAFSQVANQIKLTTEQIDAGLAELADVQHELQALEKTTATVTEDDLTQARKHRDAGWSLVKQAWLNEEDAAAIQQYAGATSLDKAYETAKDRGDEVADRLRREADLVAERAQLHEQTKSISNRIDKLKQKLKAFQSEQQEVNQGWSADWQTTGIPDPRSPREMRAWLQRRLELTRVAELLEQRGREVSGLENKLAKAQKNLRKRLKEVNASVSSDDALPQLLRQATELIAAQTETVISRAKQDDEQKRLEAKSETLDSDEKLANDELNQWESGWSDAMKWIGCAPTTTAAQALERVEGIDELSQQYDLWQEQRRKLTAIDDAAKRFASDVNQIAEKVGFDTKEEEGSATDLAKQIRKQLEDARRQKLAADVKRDAITANTAKLKSLRTDSKLTEHRLNEFIKIANVDSREQLPHVETLWQLNVERNSLADEIRNMSGGVEFHAFIEKAEGRDDAELASQVDQLQQEIDDQRAEAEKVAIQLSEVTEQMDSIDGSEHAAMADQRAINCLAEVHELAGQYVRMKIAESILRQQVERYRETNKDPLLAKASEYFSAMTCNEFSGLELSYDDKGKPIIVGIRRGDKREEVAVSAMSDGTRDPMFLSLRLAYLQHRAGEHESMPLVVDDILIHLDDERALATLRVLADLSREIQVLFFTHHDRIRNLAETHLSAEILTVHELERRGAKKAKSRKPK